MMDEADVRTLWGPTIGSSDWSAIDPATTLRPPTDPPEVGTLAGPTQSGPNVDTPPLVDAELSSRFRLITEIGRGGMGVVFRGSQDALQRDVAIKKLSGALDATAERRFISEALVTGYLDHPNIVPVHDLGRDERGEVFLAMKLVGGRSWKQLLHPQSAEDRTAAAAYDRDRHLEILHAVGNAVAFAHAKGIVHRDLKPENVMVGTFGEVLVMDWGIALDISADPSTATRAQHRSTVAAPAGTPSYMAPEQARGQGDRIGPHTDVFLLGAILHEILTGRPPHTGRSLAQVLLAAADPPSPNFSHEVPEGLQDICRSAMAADIARRLPDVPTLQQALAEERKHRESLQIAQRAQGRLAALKQQTLTDAITRNRAYGEYAAIIAGFGQALDLWADNHHAAAGVQAARIAYAEAALTNQDLALASAQAEVLPAQGAGRMLRERIGRAQQERDRAARQARLVRTTVMATIAIVIVGLGIGYVVVSREQSRTLAALHQVTEEQQRTVAERDAKEEARQEADQQRVRAEANAQTAAEQATLAEREATRAREEQQRAEEAAQASLHAAWRSRIELAKAFFDRAQIALAADDPRTAAALLVGALETAPPDTVPAGYIPQAGEPAWASFAWRALPITAYHVRPGPSLLSDTAAVADLAFLPDGSFAYASGKNLGLRLANHDEVPALSRDERGLAVTVSGDGRLVAWARLGAPIRVAETSGVGREREWGDASMLIQHLRFDPTGKRLAATVLPGTYDRQKRTTSDERTIPTAIRIWTDTGGNRQPTSVTMTLNGEPVHDLAWSEDRVLVAQSVGLRVLQLGPTPSDTVRQHPPTTTAALSPDGGRLLRSEVIEGGVRLVNEAAEDGTDSKAIFLAGASAIRAAAITADGYGIVCGDGVVHALDFNRQQILSTRRLPAASAARSVRIHRPSGQAAILTSMRSGSGHVETTPLFPDQLLRPFVLVGVQEEWVFVDALDPPEPRDPPLCGFPSLTGDLVTAVGPLPDGGTGVSFIRGEDGRSLTTLRLGPQTMPLPWAVRLGGQHLRLEVRTRTDPPRATPESVFLDSLPRKTHADEVAPGSLPLGTFRHGYRDGTDMGVKREMLVWSGDQGGILDFSITGMVRDGGFTGPTPFGVRMHGSFLVFAERQAFRVMDRENRWQLFSRPSFELRKQFNDTVPALAGDRDGTHLVALYAGQRIFVLAPPVHELVFNDIDDPMGRMLTGLAVFDSNRFDLPEHPQASRNPLHIVIDDDARHAFIAFADHSVRCWDLRVGRCAWHVTGIPTQGLAISPDGHHLAVWDGGLPGIRLIDALTGRRMATYRAPSTVTPEAPAVVAFLGDGTYLMAGTAQGCYRWQVRMDGWPRETQAAIQTFGSWEKAMEKLRQSVGARAILSGPAAGTVIPYTPDPESP